MKLKYYLRGLGIGILVTTVILSLAGLGRKGMTDEEVVKRAKELGMVESSLLSELAEKQESNGNGTNGEKQEATDDGTSVTKEENVDDGTSTVKEENVGDGASQAKEENVGDGTSQAKEENVEADTSNGADESGKDGIVEDKDTYAGKDTSANGEDSSEKKKDTAGEIYKLVIKKGESSTTVSRNLEKAGMVENASSFDKFLCSNGYDKKIITGTYEIPYGATEEEIAGIITRK